MLELDGRQRAAEPSARRASWRGRFGQAAEEAVEQARRGGAAASRP